MKFRILQIIIFLFIFISLASAQEKVSPQFSIINFTNSGFLEPEQNKHEIDTLIYVDSLSNFRVVIPAWLHIMDTNSKMMWGGILPVINGIENAIVIKSFNKSDYKSFEDFRYIYLSGNKFGQTAKYNKEHIWYGQKDPIETDKGVRQRIFTFWKNNMYHHEFVLIETKTAYLWIHFAATPDTYDINIVKFEEFMNGFETTNF